MAKALHHRGGYSRQARAVVAAAYANPATPCWRDGKTLAEHSPHRNGRAPYWTAGHVVDGEINGDLMPEVSTCNFSQGARHGNQQRTRNTTSRSW